MKTRYFLFEPELIHKPKEALRKWCNMGWSWYSCYTHRWNEHYNNINIPDGYREITEEEAFRYILEN